MRKHILPLTYAPKIPAVLDGSCTQTIRAGRKFQVGDLVMFHGWEGTPYHSKWSFRTPYWKIEVVIPCIIYSKGLRKGPGRGCSPFRTSLMKVGGWSKWNCLAEKDGIVPPTGEELGRVLLSMHTIPDTGLPAQIIRWDPTAVVE